MKQMIGERDGRRFLAFLMVLALILNMLPVSTLSAWAKATEQSREGEPSGQTDSITITVSDGNGTGVEKAEVSYILHSADADAEDISSSIRTDSDGVAEITGLPDVSTGSWTISATISKQGYLTDKTTIVDKPVVSGSQDFEVFLKVESDKIENIEITALDSVYVKGSRQELITGILGSLEGDEIFYSTDGIGWSEDVPAEEDAGDYPVYVKIAREGCNDYISEKLTAVVRKAEITDVIITAYKGDYAGEKHEAVQIEGLAAGDKVTCTYNGTDTTFTYSDENSIVVPEFENVGKYTITVTIERDSNYNIFEKLCEVEIRAIEIEGITASLKTGLVFNGQEQELIKEINGIESDDKIFFSVNDNSTWVELTEEQKPTAVNAGDYTVYIKVTRENHKDKEVELNPATVTIAKAEQTLEFTRENLEETICLDADAAKNVYDYTAAGGSMPSPVITYRVENASEDDETDISKIAEIVESGNGAGQLTVLGAGNITVTATVSGGDNYHEKSVSHNLTIVNNEDDLITFENSVVEFVIGTVKDQVAVRKYEDDNGKIVYSGTVSGSDIQLSEVGMEIGPEGKVSVPDLKALSSAIEAAGGTLSVKIRAEKGEGTKTAAWGEAKEDKVVYGEGEASYIINITTEVIPGTAYMMQDKDGNAIMAANGSNDWYNTVVRVIPAEGYSVARDEITSDYSDSVAFGEMVDGAAQDQGEAERIIYLKNNKTGGLTAPVTIAVEKLDNIKPDIQPVQFPDTVIKDDIKYYGEEITVTFTAYDRTSGVNAFGWSYIRSEEASTSILEADSGILPAKRDTVDPTKYTAELTLPIEAAQQLRGNLSVSANDAAGNYSDVLTDSGFVVDSISPTQAVSFGLAKEGGNFQTVDSTHYFPGAVEFTFDIIEANFYPEDVEITVSKDGAAGVRVQDLDWHRTETQDEQEAKIVLSEDGAYVVEMSYTDRSGQVMSPYRSDVIVVDTTMPVIGFGYQGNNGSEPQTAIITITEHNFRQSDLVVETDARTIAGESVVTEENKGLLQEYLRNCEWESVGDVHTAKISRKIVGDKFVDAIYELTMGYEDLARNPAERLVTDPFIIDYTPPEKDTMEISYSEPWYSALLSTITFGYYNPTVTVTFTAHDMTAGVDHFTWEYIRENGASIGNVEKYDAAELKAVQDPEDKTKFKASITLPKEQAEQLRGNIAFTATDQYGNESDRMVDDKCVIIVDTISPAMTVAYTAPDDIVENKMYYHSDITATFTVTEANFYSEDVKVKIGKDNGEEVEISPEWTDISTDVHVGTYTIEVLEDHSADGDYVLTVSYTDRSNNTMSAYASDILVADTTAPVRTAGFGLKGEGGNYQEVDATHYFSGPVEFTFDIVETNFYPGDVAISVSKDGVSSGQAVTWSETKNRGEHEAKCTLSEDGAYVVEMSYTDRSGQMMAPYRSEVVVVDMTRPIIGFEYRDNSDVSNPQTATVTITEHNFRQSDIEVKTDAQTITGELVQANDLQEYLRNCVWTSDGDTHTAMISTQFVDAIYELTIDYKDLAWNPAEQQVTDSFIVDHTPPAKDTMAVSYSEPWFNALLSVVTFGYYNPTVTVTFTAHDVTAGVDHFTWEYARESGASAGNVEKYDAQELTAVLDEEDKSKFTASVTLPKERAEQLRGNIAFTATDRYGNVSSKVTDADHVVIVDTISPTMTVEYTVPDNTFENKAYYNSGITATFTVTEANFYSQDVVVKVSKNNGAGVGITPVWTDVSTDVHVGTYTIDAPADHSADGDYVFTVSYTDRSNNTMNAYTSGIMVVDTTAPVIQVEYENQDTVNILTDFDGRDRKYFAASQTATITITEHNFNPEEVEYTILAQDVAGRELNMEDLHDKSSWADDGDVHVLSITFPGDANYTFGIAYTDLAKLVAEEYATEYFTVDATTPAELEISYSTSVLETILSMISFGFYNAKMTVTITAIDEISGVYSFKYSYLNAEGVSAVNAQLTEEIMEMDSITYSEDGMTATAVFEIPKQALAADSQFNGSVTFDATDRSGNESEPMQDGKRIVVDNISPTADIQYNAPVQTLDHISYYADDINATITINEANFYSEDVTVSVTRDGVAYAVTPTWVNNNTDVHTGTFTLTEDGDYFVGVTYTDKSGNIMEQYASEQLTIDTNIKEAVITVNGQEADGKAFKGDVIPAVSFEDINFQDYEIKLTRTRYGNKNMDVTDQFITGHISTNSTGGSGTFDTFEKLPENDGIYTLTVSLNDKAGHTIEKAVTFTVNRYGSVYEYSDYLVSLIQDGGAYVQHVDDNLIITEYNADRLVDGFLNIEISRDGKPLESSEYDVTPEINNTVAAGSSGWYQYQYTISKDNFGRDGVYKISISSRDATGNTPENTNYEDMGILFRVDSTPPEIDSITGLEESIINATSVEVKYTIYDTIGLESVVAYVNGNVYDRINDFTEDLNNYSGSLTLAENNSEQTVRLIVKDLAGNVTDTDSDSFSSAYAFNSSVTVSTNAFVRWFANKQLFWGSIGGTGAAVVGVSGLAIVGKRRKAAKAAKASGER